MKDKVALITGGSRGIGLAIAKAFAKQGYKVAINYRSDQQQAQKALEELQSLSDDVVVIKADVSDKADRERLLNETLQNFNRIDVLINNAAVASRYGFLKTTEEEFDRIYNCNLKAPIFLSKIVAEQMIKQGDGGSIINISSVAGHIPMGINYGGSKAALLMETKNMAAKLGPYNIRVNSISPASTKTDLNRRAWQDNPELWKSHTDNVALQRGADPSEIAGAAIYLASEQASYTTGTDILVDGGWLSTRKP